MKSYEVSVTELVFVKDELKKSDIILVAGGSRAELAKEAFRLYKEGYADFILVSGGKNKKLTSHETECNFLCDILIQLGVPKTQLIREDQASNTVENAIFSKQKCDEQKLVIHRAILVCKAFHSRRCKMTYQIHMDDAIDFCVSPIVDERNISAENWYEDDHKKKLVLNELYKIGTYFVDNI